MAIQGAGGSSPIGSLLYARELSVLGVLPGAKSTSNLLAAQIQLALGGTISLTLPGTYSFSGTLVLYSNTTFCIGPGVVLKQASGTNKKMLANYATTVSGTSVTLTWSTGVEVSVAWTAHGRMVGDWVWIDGGTPSEFRGVFRVKSVTDANNFKVDIITAGTGSPSGSWVAGAADTNITIDCQGLFDYDSANNASATGIDTMVAVLGRAHNFNIRSWQSQNALKYSLCLGALHTFDVARVGSVARCSDVVKLYGPAFSGKISNVSGAPIDDLMSLQPKEADAFATYRWTWGDIIDVEVDGVYSIQTGSAAGSSAISLYASDAARLDQIRIKNIAGQDEIDSAGILCWITSSSGVAGVVGNLEIDGVFGRSLNYGVYATVNGSTLTIDSLKVKNVNVAVAAGPQVGIWSGVTCRSCEIDGVVHKPGATPVEPIHTGNVTMDSLTIKNVRSDYTPGSTLYQVLNQQGGSANIKMLNIEQCVVNGGANSRFANFIGGTIGMLNVRKNVMPTGANFLVIGSMAATLNINLSENNVGTTAVINSTYSGTHNLSVAGNVSVGSTNGFFRFNSATLVANINGFGNSIASTVLAKVNGAETVNVVSPDMRFDVTTVARFEGGMLYNTNAAAGTLGTAGQVVCLGTAANSWKRQGNFALTY